MLDVTVKSCVIETIPVLLIAPRQADRAPVVFYIPGMWRTKSDGLALSVRLAQQGIACVSLDPVDHGDRYDPRIEHIDHPIYPLETGLDMFIQFLRVIQQSALDVGTLLAALATRPQLDTSRAGVTGISMGSYASFLAFADNPALQAAVPMMGIPTFARRWLDLLDECSFSNPDWSDAIEAVAHHARVHSAFVHSIDPAKKLAKIAPRALLMMNGDIDSDQPKHYTLDWLRTARQHYANHSDRLKWNVYPCGHTMTRQMEADAVDWFALHLGAETGEST